MAIIVIAASVKGLKSLDGTEFGKLLSTGKVIEDGSIEITVDDKIDSKLQAAKAEQGGKLVQLADRFIAKVTEARTAETETAATVVR